MTSEGRSAKVGDLAGGASMQFLGFLSYAGALWFGVMAGANMVICNELRGGDVAEAKALGSLFLSAALMVEGHRLLAYGHF